MHTGSQSIRRSISINHSSEASIRKHVEQEEELEDEEKWDGE